MIQVFRDGWWTAVGDKDEQGGRDYIVKDSECQPKTGLCSKGIGEPAKDFE